MTIEGNGLVGPVATRLRSIILLTHVIPTVVSGLWWNRMNTHAKLADYDCPAPMTGTRTFPGNAVRQTPNGEESIVPEQVEYMNLVYQQLLLLVQAWVYATHLVNMILLLLAVRRLHHQVLSPDPLPRPELMTHEV